MHDQHCFIIAAMIRQDFMPCFWIVSEGKRLWKDVQSFAITRMMRKGEIEQCFSPSRQTRTWQETEVSTDVYTGANLLKLKLLTNASICEIFAFWPGIFKSPRVLCVHVQNCSTLKIRPVYNPKPGQSRTVVPWQTQSHKCFSNTTDAPATATQSVTDAKLLIQSHLLGGTGGAAWHWKAVLRYLLSQKEFSNHSHEAVTSLPFLEKKKKIVLVDLRSED